MTNLESLGGKGLLISVVTADILLFLANLDGLIQGLLGLVD